MPEAFFDTILINGGVYPVVSVPPKRVRFRMLNGSQARFYHLNLYAEASTPVRRTSTRPDRSCTRSAPRAASCRQWRFTTMPSPARWISADPTGNTANPDGPFNLLLAPAERADVVIDFNGVSAGSSFILYNDAPAPFPGGDPRNDYFTGDPDQTAFGGAPTTLAGFGPNTRTLMKITVTAAPGIA